MADASEHRVLADAVAQIAREAGQMALARWRTDVAGRAKEDGSPVCDVDFDVDRFLRARLMALLPEAGWLSEESADHPDRLTRERVWIVDPIDGTRDYVRGRRGWCVSVALIERGRPVIGVLDAPARGEVWRAAAGQHATLDGAAIHVSELTELRGARVPIDALPKPIATCSSRSTSPIRLLSASPWSPGAGPTLSRHSAGAPSGTLLLPR